MTPEDVIRDGPLRLPVDIALPPAWRLPDDPVPFVASAERAMPALVMVVATCSQYRT